MKNSNHQGESLDLTVTAISAGIGFASGVPEGAQAKGMFHAVIRGYKEEHKEEYLDLHARLQAGKLQLAAKKDKAFSAYLKGLEAYAETLTEVKHEEDFSNLVVTVGKNFALDTILAGSAYTAAWYMGLVSLVTFTGIVAADTMASHAGWLEAGGATAPTYSGTRKTTAWAAAATGSKALSTGLVFTFTGAGTVKGCFLNTVATVDGTLGTLLSAGLFTGGDQPVVSTNTLTVTYTLSL